MFRPLLFRLGRGAMAAGVAAAASTAAASSYRYRLAACEAATPGPGLPAEPASSAKPQAPPSTLYEDPEHNAEILTQWRGHIQAAREAFERLDVESAESELKFALEKASHFGKSSGPMATSLLNLAQLYRRAGRLEEAVPLLIQAADTLEQTAGPNNKARAAPSTHPCVQNASCGCS